MFDSIAELVSRNKKAVRLMASGLLACVYLSLCLINIYGALAAAVSCAALYVFYKNIDACFMTYLILLPFGYAPFFAKLPFGMTAIKLQLFFSVLIVFLFVLYKKPYKVNTIFTVFLLILLTLYCIAWVRSFNYALAVLSDSITSKLPLYRYLMDYVSWTFTTLVPLFVITYYYRDQAGIEKIIKTVAASVVLLIGSMLFIYLFRVNDKSNFEVIRTELASFSGMHGNDLANYCILSFPLILAWALYKKAKFAFFTLFVIAVGTAVSFSRTAYFVILFGLFLLLFLIGKSRWIPLIIVVLGIALYVLIPDMIIDRALTGLDTGNYDEISAGRTDQIWGPVVDELKDKPEIILYGSGRFGYTNTDAWKMGRVAPVLHAHNMYLDCILDMGILGLILFLTFFAGILVYFIKSIRKIHKTSPFAAYLLNGCLVSVICYLISGFSGRSFFPSTSNVYLWIVIGLGIAVSRFAQMHEPYNPAVSN